MTTPTPEGPRDRRVAHHAGRPSTGIDGCPVHPMFGAAFEQRPLEYYQYLRQAGPVVRVKLDPAGSFWGWLVLDVTLQRDILQDREGQWTSDPRAWCDRELVQANHPLLRHLDARRHVQHADGPRHARLRAPIVAALSNPDHQTRRDIAHLADSLIAHFAGLGQADLEHDYAQKLPLRVMMNLLGIDSRFSDEVDASVHELIRSGPQADQAAQRIDAIMRQLVEEKYRHPGNDLISSMLQAGPTDAVDIHEVADQAWFLLSVGLGSTAAWISNAVLKILTDDDGLLDQVINGQVTVDDVVARVIWDNPPLQNMFNRWPLQDMELGGCRISRGQLVIISFAASGSDPATRPSDPAAAVGHRAHLAWGTGNHECPAQDLASEIVSIALSRLLVHIPDLQLAIPRDDLVWGPPLVVRGPASLPVTFTPVEPDHIGAPRCPHHPPSTSPPPPTPTDPNPDNSATPGRSSWLNFLAAFRRGR
ncbi:hypothetical protein AB0D08_06765 [Kitasatospora sp. NPDC048540]|uniref:hypothetical protein n=1 Tax=Kitasatospora sp. NPDC048540 TaxID=3155634 RepID=UPI0033CB427B